jgi:hypothetical protein
LTNGELLARAQGQFDVFITLDSGVAFQQNLTRYNLAVVILLARSNRLSDTAPLVPKILLALEEIEAGSVIKIS